MDPFPTGGDKQPQKHKPEIGSPLVLRCEPPYSYPTGSIYWALTEIGQDQNSPIQSSEFFTQVPLNDRVAIGYDGK